ncbi:MAG: hypothetical protein SFU91_03560 [Chloroherpetonaceae bacterium]|nr:hypothetical protein [Chloroherpetonaceae bacterium]
MKKKIFLSSIAVLFALASSTLIDIQSAQADGTKPKKRWNFTKDTCSSGSNEYCVDEIIVTGNQ